MPSSFVPTEAQRRQVTVLAGLGMKHQQIASLVGVHSTTTLRKHFRSELLAGPVKAAMKVRRTLYEMATSGQNQVATMFWLKTRAGWSEKGKEPETVETRKRPRQMIVRFVEPNRCPETGKLLEPVAEDEQNCEYWKIGEDGEEIPVRGPRRRTTSKPIRATGRAPESDGDDREP